MKKLKWCLVILFVSLLAKAVETLLTGTAFSKNDGGWKTQPYWGGKAELVKEGDRQLLELTATNYKDARLFGQLLNPASKRIICSKGTRIAFEITAKGKGVLVPGIIAYDFDRSCQGTSWCNPLELTDSMNTLKAEITIDECRMFILPALKIEGRGTARFAKVRVILISDDGISITPPSLQIVPEDTPVQPVAFTVSPKNHTYDVVVRMDNIAVNKTQVPDANGCLPVVWEQMKMPSGVAQFTVASKGREATAFAVITSRQEYDTTDALAKKLHIRKPISILFIGDSLSDFFRGYNYIDRLKFWADKYNPEKLTVRNAGVGGDFITRVEDRLNAIPPGTGRPAHRQEMYDKLFDTPYDFIFIFLGHNDTRSIYGEKTPTPLVSPETQAASFNHVCDFIQKRSNAKIVLIAPSPSNIRAFDARINKLKPGQKLSVFGIDALTDDYDAVNRKLCKERGFQYLDILSVMRADPDRASLYVPDGVHLSPKGARIITDELLKFLANQP